MSSINKHVAVRAVALTKPVDLVILKRPDELVGKTLCRDVENPGAGVSLEDRVTDGIDQMGLAEADTTIDEERVVAPAGVGAASDAGGVCELIGRPDDEVLEAVFRVEVRGLRGAWRRPRLRRSRRGDRLARGLRLFAERFVELPANLRRDRGVARLALKSVEDHVEVVRRDPLCEELIGDPQHDRIALEASELNRLEPGLEVLRCERCVFRLSRACSHSRSIVTNPQKARTSPLSSPSCPHSETGRVIQSLFHQLPPTWRPPTGVF